MATQSHSRKTAEHFTYFLNGDDLVGVLVSGLVNRSKLEREAKLGQGACAHRGRGFLVGARGLERGHAVHGPLQPAPQEKGMAQGPPRKQRGAAGKTSSRPSPPAPAPLVEAKAARSLFSRPSQSSPSPHLSLSEEIQLLIALCSRLHIRSHCTYKAQLHSKAVRP